MKNKHVSGDVEPSQKEANNIERNIATTITAILSHRYGIEITTEESNENTVRTLRPVTANVGHHR